MSRRSSAFGAGVVAGVALRRGGTTAAVVFLVALVGFLVIGGATMVVVLTADQDGDVGQPTPARISRVIDGDTVVVTVPGRSHPKRVRLLGVDAPELASDKTTADCWSSRSRAALRRLLPAGTEVELRDDSSQDSRDVYGRLLRYVGSDRVRDAGAEMIRRGDARAGVEDFKIARLDDYDEMASRASDADLGLWRACTLG